MSDGGIACRCSLWFDESFFVDVIPIVKVPGSVHIVFCRMKPTDAKKQNLDQGLKFFLLMIMIE